MRAASGASFGAIPAVTAALEQADETAEEAFSSWHEVAEWSGAGDDQDPIKHKPDACCEGIWLPRGRESAHRFGELAVSGCEVSDHDDSREQHESTEDDASEPVLANQCL